MFGWVLILREKNPFSMIYGFEDQTRYIVAVFAEVYGKIGQADDVYWEIVYPLYFLPHLEKLVVLLEWSKPWLTILMKESYSEVILWISNENISIDRKI